MIQYAKKVLPNFGAWEFSFRKELVKIYNWMPEDEKYEFYNWCYANFYHKYPNVLDEILINATIKNKLCISK